MMRWMNWRNALAAAAILIVSGTIIYSQYLSRKIAADETLKVKTWVEAQRTVLKTNDPAILTLASTISQENDDIPIIETDERDSITSFRNIDSAALAEDPGLALQ